MEWYEMVLGFLASSGLGAYLLNRYGKWAQKLVVWGRRSELFYVRFYPNPGFMVPLPRGRQLVWTNFDGLFTRKRGTRTRPVKKVS